MSDMELSNGLKMPIIGFGCYQIYGEDAYNAVVEAIKVGYRHIDTAESYENDEQVGKAVNNCIKEGIVKREELFITTKLNPHNKIGYQETKEAIEGSLKRLQLDYIDLYLIHWPNVTPDDRWKRLNADSWRAMEEFYEQGKIKSLGVSNFLQHHLRELDKTAKIKPVVNQLNLNPTWPQEDLVAYCKERNMVCCAWSPLVRLEPWNEKIMNEVAQKYGKSTQQISLRWSIQKGFVPLVKSTHKDRMIANMNIFDFVIDDEDMKRLDNLLCHPASHDATPDSIYTVWKQMLEIINLKINKKTIKKEKYKLFNLIPIYKVKFCYAEKVLKAEKHYLFGFLPFMKKVYEDELNASIYFCGLKICKSKKIMNPWAEINTLPVYEDYVDTK